MYKRIIESFSVLLCKLSNSLCSRESDMLCWYVLLYVRMLVLGVYACYATVFY